MIQLINTLETIKYNKNISYFLCLLCYFFPKAVAITSCGNFAIIGLSSGAVDVYNMQSGIHRGSFGRDQGIGLFFLSYFFLKKYYR